MAGISIGMPAVHGATTNGGKSAVDMTPNLPTVVIRLLGMALKAIDCPVGPIEQERTLIPSDYRRWPFVETETSHLRGRARLRYYVCSQGAATSDDRLFPAGTCLVIETYRCSIEGLFPKQAGSLCGQDPIRIFVMKKFTTLPFACLRGRASDREAWVRASYTSCAIGRVA